MKTDSLLVDPMERLIAQKFNIRLFGMRVSKIDSQINFHILEQISISSLKKTLIFGLNCCDSGWLHFDIQIEMKTCLTKETP